MIEPAGTALPSTNMPPWVSHPVCTSPFGQLDGETFRKVNGCREVAKDNTHTHSHTHTQTLNGIHTRIIMHRMGAIEMLSHHESGVKKTWAKWPRASQVSTWHLFVYIYNMDMCVYVCDPELNEKAWLVRWSRRLSDFTWIQAPAVTAADLAAKNTSSTLTIPKIGTEHHVSMTAGPVSRDLLEKKKKWFGTKYSMWSLNTWYLIFFSQATLIFFNFQGS